MLLTDTNSMQMERLVHAARLLTFVLNLRMKKMTFFKYYLYKCNKSILTEPVTLIH